jgi:hypothetical protein
MIRISTLFPSCSRRWLGLASALLLAAAVAPPPALAQVSYVDPFGGSSGTASSVIDPTP